MTSIRDGNGNIKTNVYIGLVLAAMLVAMVPAMTTFNTASLLHSAEADHSEDRPYSKVFAKTALYGPAVGRTNLFGPGGIFPFFNDTFTCTDSVLTCGVMSEDANFRGVFKDAGEEGENMFVAEYTSPITYGDHQMAEHKYRIELVDTMWNNPEQELTPTPTRVPQFLAAGNGVAFDHIQHGSSMVDRADAPMFMNKVALYDHVNVYDVTNGGKELVVERVFTHLMVGHIVDEGNLYTNFQFDSPLPLVAALFVVNVPSGVELPGGIGPLTSGQAQSFTPMSDDPSLTNLPPINYKQLSAQEIKLKEPLPQSTVWAVDNPTQPVYFTFLLFTETKAFKSSTNELPGVN